ncbi:hypothetical protein T265_02471 [Opisthorchis viverrini]|uniref:Uncharacterized protein n=1 Tax=Opisthorchis viverrini TaxID=6198 RepID=A0A074ZUZ7_OPIVI|nr:hypothetical protein T265_02471 [Opisthorchis viverrini]KER31288.1 hypothetical protein T265_02471 [Opisthorchis viverrini]
MMGSLMLRGGCGNDDSVPEVENCHSVHIGTIFKISQYIFIEETTHKVAENSSTAHDRLTETRGLRLPDEPQEGRNRSWAVEEFSATFAELFFIAYGRFTGTVLPVSRSDHVVGNR